MDNLIVISILGLALLYIWQFIQFNKKMKKMNEEFEKDKKKYI